MGNVGDFEKTIMALDDISIESGDCDKSSPQQNLFHCNARESIPASKVCNGVKDCSNGADEADCGSCDFTNHNGCGYGVELPG